MTYWIQWREADGRKGRRRGPFHHHQDAVRGIEEDLKEFSDLLEYGTTKRPVWFWDTTHQVATLWRDDMFHDEKPTGHYVIEQVAPEARTDDDDTDTA